MKIKRDVLFSKKRQIKIKRKVPGISKDVTVNTAAGTPAAVGRLPGAREQVLNGKKKARDKGLGGCTRRLGGGGSAPHRKDGSAAATGSKECGARSIIKAIRPGCNLPCERPGQEHTNEKTDICTVLGTNMYTNI